MDILVPRFNLIILVGVVGVMIPVACTQKSSTSSPKITGRNSLPELDEVKSMTATITTSQLISRGRGLPEQINFQVPPKSWKVVFGALKPASVDSSPAKWEGLGSLVVETKKGDKVTVSLYTTWSDSGAFSIQRGKDRQYFRGGSDERIETAIRHAYKLAQSK